MLRLYVWLLSESLQVGKMMVGGVKVVEAEAEVGIEAEIHLKIWEMVVCVCEE